ncbi:hypothetical protein F4821DRAFT_159482 [Hypoxylon rubiginosum]|uniref:Uncharacterized protein n=1 Tax=Hypoxylon rubiginosum TaxID=110542 RepID=A0ACC0DI80_9PEZI|nr:hypothetical protein F4821DRAFT_159482 [Hypoxylon rubiginosum]
MLSNMKSALWGQRNVRNEEDDSSETNEPFLESKNAHTIIREKPRPYLKAALVVSLILNIFLLFLGFSHSLSRYRASDSFQRLELYTPAKDAIEYRNELFHNPIPGQTDDYAGPPTPERNDKWKALYYVGETSLTKSEASRLHNKTVAAKAGTDEDYPIVFTVFHDLHCLDAIRLTLGYLRDDKWNSTYNPYSLPWPKEFEDGLYSVDHSHHCMNGIRQSLQCASDVTPQVFQYVPERDMIRSNFNVLHTCRNFDAVRQWSLERKLKGEFNRNGWRDEQGICGPDGCS